MTGPVAWFGRRFLAADPDLVPNLLARLAGTPARAEDILRAVPRDVRVRRDGDAWSMQENAGHMLDLEPLWDRRIDELLAGAPVLSAADLENRRTHAARHGERDVGELLGGLRAARGAIVARLSGLSAADFVRSSRHPRLDQPMRLVDLCAFVAEHDDHHLARMRELARKAGFGTVDVRSAATRSHRAVVDLPVGPEAAFALLLRPSAIRGWWSAARAIVVPRAGGTWAAAWGADEDAPDYAVVATIAAFDPPRRLRLDDYRYTSRSGPLPFEADFVVEFTVHATAAGARVEVVQSGFPTDRTADDHLAACERGWRDTLRSLRAFAVG